MPSGSSPLPVMASTLRAWASAWSHCRLTSPDFSPLGGASLGGPSIRSLSPSSPSLSPSEA